MGCSSSTSSPACAASQIQRNRKREAALRQNSIARFYALGENGINQEVFTSVQQDTTGLEVAAEVESTTVVIAKEEGVPLGVALALDREYEQAAVVTSIDEDGYLGTWNRTHPANKVLRLGDRIVSVNDCRSDYWEMLAQLWWRAGECKLTVKRNPNIAESQHRSGSRLYLAEYMSAQACSKLVYGSSLEYLRVTRAADASASQCAVCLEDYEDPEEKVVVLPCNHIFHSGCASRWLNKGRKCCPLCKFVLSDPGTRQRTHDKAGMGHPTNIEATSI